jgi:hypothetical protein
VVSTTSPAQEPADGDDAVHLSSTVRVRDADGEEEYTIVRSAEALVVRGRISMESPVGRALLGRRPLRPPDIRRVWKLRRGLMKHHGAGDYGDGRIGRSARSMASYGGAPGQGRARPTVCQPQRA